MNQEQFLRDRRDDWQALEKLLVERRRGARGKADPLEFSRLLRAVSHDLSTATSRDWGGDVVRYLNELIVRAHNSFHGESLRRTGAIWPFFAREFPALLRRERRYFLVASLLFFGPLILAAVAIAQRPELAERVLPRTILVQFENMYEQLPSRGSEKAGASSSMAGFYVYNNVGIAFRCFATGIVLGLGSVFFLLYNGIVIGAVTGTVIAAGHGDAFLSFVVGHGAFELTGIAIAGAAGLVLGDGVVRPGPYARGESLWIRGRDAVRLALGAGGMIAVAALVEAFWSPSTAPAVVKYWVGGGLWLLVIAYLSFGGRESSRAPV